MVDESDRQALEELNREIAELEEKRDKNRREILEAALKDGEATAETRIDGVLHGLKGHNIEAVDITLLRAIVLAKGVDREEFTQALDKLKREGELYEPTEGHVAKI
jgi:DNA replicative helicase MCM subunit Mcm2 (Cdc46/Mcm family)